MLPPRIRAPTTGRWSEPGVGRGRVDRAQWPTRCRPDADQTRGGQHMTTDAPAERASEAVELSGHIIDSGLFTGILDEITAGSGRYDVEQFQVGRTHDDPSYLRLLVTAPTEHALDRLLGRLQ